MLLPSSHLRDLAVNWRLNVMAPGSEAMAGAGAHVLLPKLKDAGAVYINTG
jgi:hypothetical protein